MWMHSDCEEGQPHETGDCSGGEQGTDDGEKGDDETLLDHVLEVEEEGTGEE